MEAHVVRVIFNTNSDDAGGFEELREFIIDEFHDNFPQIEIRDGRYATGAPRWLPFSEYLEGVRHT